MSVRPREKVDAVAEAAALDHGQAPTSLRRGQGGPEGGGGEDALVVDVALHEVNGAPEAAQLEAPLLFVVAGVAKRDTDVRGGGYKMEIKYKTSGG